jgi:nucleoid-associated protein EbfC
VRGQDVEQKETAVFKGLANLGNLMRQAQEMGGRLEEVGVQLKAKRVSGTAGGGMVEVEANGLGEILRLTIDPQLIERQEKDMIEDLVPAAINQALRNAREAHAEMIKSMTDGLDVPGLDDMIARIAKLSSQDDR